MDRRQPNRLRSHQTRRNDSCRLAFRVAARRGQVEEETRAATLGAFRSKRAGVRFDNRTSDCQAHAHSFRFCGKEMIENFLPPVRGQAGTEIAHTDFRTLSFKRTCTNNDAALGGRKRFHRVEGVDDQVEQYLLNLDRGSFHIRQARIEVRNDGSFPDQNVGTHEPQGIGDYSVQGLSDSGWSSLCVPSLEFH